MSLNHLKDKHRNFLLELLQKYEKIFDCTLGKSTDSAYTIDFSYTKNLRTNSQERN